jgi:hypothetical protein
MIPPFKANGYLPVGMIQDDFELATTKRKLAELEAAFDAARLKTDRSEYSRRLSMQSVRRMINQLTEEIVQYESRTRAAKAASPTQEVVS